MTNNGSVNRAGSTQSKNGKFCISCKDFEKDYLNAENKSLTLAYDLIRERRQNKKLQDYIQKNDNNWSPSRENQEQVKIY
jgi:hypothetical protein